MSKGILVAGMEMPESCAKCKFIDFMFDDFYKCRATGRDIYDWYSRYGDEMRWKGCPLKEVKK